ncbi:MAG TPA: tetratricopeptide repeat protein [Kofleriaceae bacterium]|nr:tetratricopeptide repeat protein [Kofleriaceae bacterium]
MSMRRTAIALPLAAGLALVAAPLRADTFRGFSGVDRPYLVNEDRVCHPLAVAAGAAAGPPRCEKVAADAIARLSIKPPIAQSGAKASFTAQASGRTITVSRKTGGTLVTWDAPDPVVRIVELYASQYEDRVAIAYMVRRAGREVTDIVAFDLGQNQTAVRGSGAPGLEEGRGAAPGGPGSAGSTEPSPSAPETAARAEPPPSDPKIAKAIAEAHAAPRGRALAAWSAVLALDPANPEALFRSAAAQLAARHSAQALVALQSLAASGRSDAIEWQVEARFDPAFAALRADPKFRAAVGLDRKPTTTYERLMGFGGQWEQTGTSCDKPEVRLVASRDRKFRLRVTTRCEGSVLDTPFQGTWRIDGERIVLQLPTHGRAVTAADEAPCVFEPAGDEDALRCALGRDLDFVVLPTRR